MVRVEAYLGEMGYAPDFSPLRRQKRIPGAAADSDPPAHPAAGG